MAFAPDGRLFVCLQGGEVRVIKDGTLLTPPFTRVTADSEGERGLLGVAFDPHFATNGYVYVYYTATTPTKHNRVSRFTANGDVAVLGSEVVILELDTLSAATNHNGGAIHFGPDGKLYVAVGDNANGAAAQSLTSRFGKVLRLNADGSIPNDNPFYALAAGPLRAIWAVGLRNPFTFAFHHDSGRLFINDVGEVSFEEINEGIIAANYGWPQSEGATSNPNHTAPAYFYGHGSGAFAGCAITGGAFYVPAVGQFPSEYVGSYFFADYCGGWITTFDVTAGSVRSFASGLASPVDLKVGPDGSLYYLARGSGSVGKISYKPSEAPVITRHPSDQSVPVGGTATFSVEAAGSEPLSYQWQRNGVDIAGATLPTYATNAVTDADGGALFRARVRNAFGTATSTAARLTVSSNSLPVATITSPAQGTLYTAGTVINYAGGGSDPEDGTLPPSALTWRIDFHHDEHMHPFVPATRGSTTGSFTIPRSGETSANVWYRIILTVIDSRGASTTTFRDIRPRTVSVTLDSRPHGLQLTLDGQPVSAPHTFTTVVGLTRTVGAPLTQPVDGVNYSFLSWSDGGAAEHDVIVGAADAPYIVTFVETSTGQLYLSDASWTSMTNGWGPAERNMSNGETSASDGRVITLDGVAFVKGLGVHAPSTLIYPIPAGCAEFRATVGVDDEVGANGSMTFAVWADGVRLFDSGPLLGTTPGRDVVVDISGRSELRLVAGSAGDNINADHGDWAAARFVCGATPELPQQLYLSDASWTSMTNGWGPAERNLSNGETSASDGRVITLEGVAFAKGLGVHAPSELRYAIPAGCTEFQATVGVDDEVGANGSMTFGVWADGVLLFESGPLLGTTPGRDVVVDIGGRSELRLVAGSAGDSIHSDHGDWAAARLTCEVPPDSQDLYLSDVSWTSMTNGWGPAERNLSNGETSASDGRVITLDGVAFVKGLGVHAPSTLIYPIPAGCGEFRATVGVDDEVGANGSMTFAVWADGVQLFDSGPLLGTTPGRDVVVDISGRSELRLVAGSAGDNINSDHGDWAAARFVCATTVP